MYMKYANAYSLKTFQEWVIVHETTTIFYWMKSWWIFMAIIAPPHSEYDCAQLEMIANFIVFY